MNAEESMQAFRARGERRRGTQVGDTVLWDGIAVIGRVFKVIGDTFWVRHDDSKHTITGPWG